MGFSSCGSRALDHRINSYSPWAWLLWGMWDLPWSGMEPLSPALAGGFSTTEPRGKPPSICSNASHWQLPCLAFCSYLSIFEVPACDHHLLLVCHFQPFQGLEELAGHALGAAVKLLDVRWLLWCPHSSWSWNLSCTSPETEVQHRGSHSTALAVVSKVFMLGHLDGVCPSNGFQLPGKRLPKPWWTPAGSPLLW